MSHNVVREIDKLGRLVLPKSMRDSAGIKLGSFVKLELVGDKIYISKYNCLLGLKDFAELVCESIYDVTGEITIVSDCQHIIAASGISKCVNSEIEYNDGFLIVGEKEIKISDIISVDITKNGECVGVVLLASKDKKLESLRPTIKLFAKFLGRLIDG